MWVPFIIPYNSGPFMPIIKSYYQTLALRDRVMITMFPHVTGFSVANATKDVLEGTEILDTDHKAIAKRFAELFIARNDVMAIQRPSGEYNPVKEAFKMQSLLAHLDGSLTYGHYLLNTDNECKFFAFDIDLDKEGLVPTEVKDPGVWCNFQPGKPRELWHNRAAIMERNYFKFQLRMLGGKLLAAIQRELGVRAAIAYSGNKGIHVYGFTGLVPAEVAREGALLVMKQLDCFDLVFGDNFYKHRPITESAIDAAEFGLHGQDHLASYSAITIEVFPKQIRIAPGGYGNLLRLPLGRNLKNPKDPTFFMDVRGHVGQQSFMRRDALDALSALDQWA